MTKHVKARWFRNERNLPDGSYIDSDNDVCYIKNGKIHREDGPAIEHADGTKRWYINGKQHREDGPSVEWINGDKYWCVNNKFCGTEVAYEEALKIWKMNEAMK